MRSTAYARCIRRSKYELRLRHVLHHGPWCTGRLPAPARSVLVLIPRKLSIISSPSSAPASTSAATTRSGCTIGTASTTAACPRSIMLSIASVAATVCAVAVADTASTTDDDAIFVCKGSSAVHASGG